MVGLVIPVLFVILGDQVRNELVFSSANMMLTAGLCLWGWGVCVHLCFCFVSFRFLRQPFPVAQAGLKLTV